MKHSSHWGYHCLCWEYNFHFMHWLYPMLNVSNWINWPTSSGASFHLFHNVIFPLELSSAILHFEDVDTCVPMCAARQRIYFLYHRTGESPKSNEWFCITKMPISSFCERILFLLKHLKQLEWKHDMNEYNLTERLRSDWTLIRFLRHLTNLINFSQNKSHSIKCENVHSTSCWALRI